MLKCGSQNGARTDLQITSRSLKTGGDNVFHLGFDILKGFWKIRILKYFSNNSNVVKFTWNLDDFIKGNVSKPFVISLENLAFSIIFFTNFELTKKYFKIRIFQNPFGISNPRWNTLSPPIFKVREVVWRSVWAPFWLPHLSNFSDL